MVAPVRPGAGDGGAGGAYPHRLRRRALRSAHPERPPSLAISVVVLGAVAVLAAAAALVRYYARATRPAPAPDVVEIPAPELEPGRASHAPPQGGAGD